MCKIRAVFLQIADFGLAKWKDYTRTLTNAKPIGTLSHIPPEKWLDPTKKPDEKYDVYSFAVLFCETATETDAFKEVPLGDILIIRDWTVRILY